MTSGGRSFGEGFAVVPDAVIVADVSANAKLLWLVLQRHSDPDGRCYPSLKRLGEILGTSADTVRRAKKELLDAHLIDVVERFDDHGRRTSDDVILRGAPSKSARGVGSKSARVNKEAFELEPERTNGRAKGGVAEPANPFGADTPVSTFDGTLSGPSDEDRRVGLAALRSILQRGDVAS